MPLLLAELLLNLSRPFAENPDNVSALVALRGERGGDGSTIPVGNWRDSNNGLGRGEHLAALGWTVIRQGCATP